MSRIRYILVALAISVLPLGAHADCGISDSGEVNILTNYFETLEILANAMKECETDSLKIDVKLTTTHKEERERAFEAASSPYDGSAVANSSISSLQAKGQLMSLNDLVDKYRDEYQIEDQMLIRFGDDISAVAFMANAQHFFYRTDLFEKYGLAVPSTFDELLEVAEVLKAEESISYPFGAAFGGSGGWEVANEFVNLLLANNGALFDTATSEPVFDSQEGLEALEMMGKLSMYMSPNALALDFLDVKRQLQQSEVAMAILWGNEANGMDKPEESTVVGKVAFAPSPAMVTDGPPATTFWWDGYVIPKNLDGDPDLTFRVIMHALSPSVVENNNDSAIWVRSNYVPTKYAAAPIDSVMAGAPPYPMNPQSSLAHGALGNNIGDYLAGKESAAQSLADAAADYRSAAKDAGLL